MKIARLLYRDRIYYGQVQEDHKTIALIEGDIWDSYTINTQQIPLTDVTLLAPVEPPKLICVGLNYASHAKESNIPQLPSEPLIFMCSPAAIIADGQEILLNSTKDRIDYEAELAVIIKRKSKNLQIHEVTDSIFGYTCANDVSNRHLQKKDGQFTRAKSFDTYKPLGPWIETELNLDKEQLQLWQNGKLKQSAPLHDMIFSVHEIVQFISHIMTLEPGDVILTGTPSGVGPLSTGDQVEIEIPGIGRLHNSVK